MRQADDEREAWIALATAPGVGPATFARLLAAFGTARHVLVAATEPGADASFRAIVPRSRGLAASIRAAGTEWPATSARLAGSNVRVVLAIDPGYPDALRSVPDAPAALFVAGSLDGFDPTRAVAVVGTRRPTEGGRRLAGEIASAISRVGATVVSGLAVGIDGAAHAASVAADAPTVAVIGGGHDRLFPRAHRRLADAIVASGGAVVAEEPPWAHAVASSFPRRNRLISGLSAATVVVEAGRRSGALITAALALEQGRGCFLVPGPIDAPQSAGCLAFLRENAGAARIVAGVPELIEDLGLPSANGGDADADRRHAATLATLGRVEAAVAAAVARGATTLDDLVAATALPVPTLLAAVTLLETRGLVVDVLGTFRPSGNLLGIGVVPPRTDMSMQRPPSAG